jgi:RimJ/RimL family protein N-acetyltransferase
MMIETERLLLREYTMDDFDALYEIMSDAETMQHYPAKTLDRMESGKLC